MSDERFQPDEALARTGGRMAAARSLDEIVAVLRRSARRIVGSDGIAVVLREDGFCFYAAEDAIEPLWMGRRFPLEACVSGWAMLHDETVVVPDIDHDRRVPAAAYRTTSMRSLVIVPIGSPTPVAALGAYWCASVLPGAETIRRLQALAHDAAIALTRVGAGPIADHAPA